MLEDIFMSTGYRFFGTDGQDYLTTSSVSGDAIRVRLQFDDVFYLQGERDSILCGAGNDTAYGGSGNDSLSGEEGQDKLMAGIGNDTLVGGTEDDLLNGGKGNDLVNGGTGADRLVGDRGQDNFVFLLGDGQDRIADFQLRLDTIDLNTTNFSFASANGGLDTILTYGSLGDQILLRGVAFADSDLVVII
jgi:Ca2+-binding RTX toxin-like protein